MKINKRIRIWIVLFFCYLSLSGCVRRAAVVVDQPVEGLTPTIQATKTPFEPLNSTETITPSETPTLVPVNQVSIWIGPSVPNQLSDLINFQVNDPESVLKMADSQEAAQLSLESVEYSNAQIHWIYALVAPFPTVEDGVSLDDIQRAWKGEGYDVFGQSPLLMTEKTKAALSTLWGDPADSNLKIMRNDELLEYAWNNRPSWAIIPFDDIVPRWKVLTIDEKTPLDSKFDPSTYPLSVSFGWTGKDNLIIWFTERNPVVLPDTNRDPEKLTVLVMTGTTALVRAIGAKMETNGMTYPAEDILSWLKDADITHISNEVSFAIDCPNADPYQHNLRFCSRPEYIELLDYVGADVIELTGNHILDWGREAFDYTLQLYDDRHWLYYGGGRNLQEARKPVYIENHGNKLAFIGCNLPGPSQDWATEELSGAAKCEDYAWVKEEIEEVAGQGYLPIVTLQHNEFLSLVVTPGQKADFDPLAEAGAVIVSGSQAHYPNPFGFVNNQFIHYGLGNLFFDQMDAFIAPGVQREFIDRHIFYNGKYINTEILTAHLEDFSRPRPMTAEERSAFLDEAFKASGW